MTPFSPFLNGVFETIFAVSKRVFELLFAVSKRGFEIGFGITKTGFVKDIKAVLVVVVIDPCGVAYVNTF